VYVISLLFVDVFSFSCIIFDVISYSDNFSQGRRNPYLGHFQALRGILQHSHAKVNNIKVSRERVGLLKTRISLIPLGDRNTAPTPLQGGGSLQRF